MTEEITYKLSQRDFQEVIENTLAKQIEDKIYNRFEGVTINAKTACHILRISNPTMHTYIKNGYLVPEDRVSGGDLYFSLSQILKFNKVEVQKHLRYSNTIITKI